MTHQFLGYEISQNSYPIFIAELSCNHCGKIENVFSLIDQAKRAHADIVKIQVYTPDEMTFKKSYKIQKGLWKGKDLYELYQASHTPPKWIRQIFDYANNIQMPIFASVFGQQSLEALEEVGCEAYKVASYEANDYRLIRSLIRTKKPIMLSTGACTFAEIQRADSWFPDGYQRVYMHCVSKYPCPDYQASLQRIHSLGAIVGSLNVGYSDHTKGSVTAPIAAALGAKYIEKHFYDPKLGKSEDARFSLSMQQFKNMVAKVKNACDICRIDLDADIYEFKRSLYAVKRMRKGDIIETHNIKALRPYKGLDAHMWPRIQGLEVNTNIPAGTPLIGDYIEWNPKTNLSLPILQNKLKRRVPKSQTKKS